jgi:hypothetical protein
MQQQKPSKNTDFQIEINSFVKNNVNCLGFAFFEEHNHDYSVYSHKTYSYVKPHGLKERTSGDPISCCIRNVSAFRQIIFPKSYISYGTRIHPDYMACYSRFVSLIDNLKIFYVMIGQPNIEIDKQKFIDSIYWNALLSLGDAGKEIKS